jgi:ubiquinone/menaquinone biosynthesis C-methylase UbiE
MSGKRSIDVTGEVISPDHENITPLFMRHMAAYNLFIKYVGGKKVLEVGFGEGYGTDFLSAYTAEITGMDFSQDLVEHARAKYAKKKGLWYLRGDATDIPFSNGKFEALISSQVLEHIKDYPKFLREASRVISDDGLAVFATPNRKMMIDGVNPYHYKEFSPRELEKALKKVFKHVEIIGLFGSDAYLELKALEQGYAKKILAIDFLRLRRLVPRFMLKPLYKRAFESVNQNTETASAQAAKITINDFYTDTSKLDKALDLIGVCRK